MSRMVGSRVICVSKFRGLTKGTPGRRVVNNQEKKVLDAKQHGVQPMELQ